MAKIIASMLLIHSIWAFDSSNWVIFDVTHPPPDIAALVHEAQLSASVEAEKKWLLARLCEILSRFFVLPLQTTLLELPSDQFKKIAEEFHQNQLQSPFLLNLVVCGLSTIQRPISDVLRELTEMGIDFTFTAPPRSIDKDQWEKGVLFIDEFEDKGKIFLEMLEYFPIRPIQIILIRS
jgi:hypothetical protein